MYRKTIGTAMLIAGASFMVIPTATAKDNPKLQDHKVWVCHATSSDTNPYVIINVDKNSVKYRGHLMHKTDPNKTWKDAGNFASMPHVAGELKPDIIGTADPASIAGLCFDSTTPPTTVPPTTVPPKTATVPPVVKTVKPSPVTTTETAAPPVVGKKTPPAAPKRQQVIAPPVGGVEAGDGSSAGNLANTGFGSAPLFGGLAMFLAGIATLVGKRLTLLRK